MTYKVLIGNSPEELEKLVVNFKALGWKEQGGLSMSYPTATHFGVTNGAMAQLQFNQLVFGQSMYWPEQTKEDP